MSMSSTLRQMNYQRAAEEPLSESVEILQKTSATTVEFCDNTEIYSWYLRKAN